jgi:hypothetical protein
VFVEGIALGGDPGMHKRGCCDAERVRRERPLGNPLVADSNPARATDQYHVTGASPGLNRVFRLLPQRLEGSAASVAEADGSRQHPGNGVEPQWNATIRTPRGVGRLVDSLKLWA